ncbi:MAG TPA: glycosyltransferase [Xanthomonadaceae bacterium]|nr:glycosyltransferase [Xanthomonadaceae bacterium]
MTERDPAPASEVVLALLHAQDAASRAFLERWEAERRCAEAQARLDLVQGSVSFALGRSLVEAIRSWRAALALPMRLRDAARRRGRAGAMPATMGVPPIPRWPGTAEVASRRERTPPGTLRELRIAAVLDAFSEQVFAPECTLVNLASSGFEAILDELSPHMLFVESAWRGRDGEWRNLLSPVSAQLAYLVDCCRRRGIPTVFWNKEDPTHFGHFLEAARLFDFVFTTDAGCVPRYVEALGHSRVHALAFACQPRRHNPLELAGERRQAACFAGSWYRAYPDRCEAFDALVAAVGSVMPVEIYDRNLGRGDPAFAFPDRYRPLIRGSVPYAEMAEVYKSYAYAITVNSVRASPTMLARRVYELLACNAVVVSNPTEAVARLFGDVVVGASAGEDVAGTLRDLADDPGRRDRRRLRGLRAVLAGHTAGDRLRQVCATVLGRGVEAEEPQVLLVARARNARELLAIREAYVRQTWRRKRLCLLLAEEAIGLRLEGVDGVCHVDEGAADTPSFALSAQWIASLHPDDHYGPRYVEDLVLATRYAPDQARIGKARRFQARDGACLEDPSAPAYRVGPFLSRRSMIERCLDVGLKGLSQLIDRMEEAQYDRLDGLVVDGFEYCLGGALQPMDRVEV